MSKLLAAGVEGAMATIIDLSIDRPGPVCKFGEFTQGIEPCAAEPVDYGDYCANHDEIVAELTDPDHVPTHVMYAQTVRA